MDLSSTRNNSGGEPGCRDRWMNDLPTHPIPNNRRDTWRIRWLQLWKRPFSQERESHLLSTTSYMAIKLPSIEPTFHMARYGALSLSHCGPEATLSGSTPPHRDRAFKSASTEQPSVGHTTTRLLILRTTSLSLTSAAPH